MGLTGRSTGAGLLNCRGIHTQNESEQLIVALAGNPNVGKSTLFNGLTGLNQHTGNWPGKTVTGARGICRHKDKSYVMVDIPGTYSLMANSAEEEVARDFICFGRPDVTVIVADATCLERNLNLALQTTEVTGRVVLCVNLMDEAKKKKISIDLELLSRRLGIPAVGTSARSKKGLDALMEAIAALAEEPPADKRLRITYGDEIEAAVSLLKPAVADALPEHIDSRWVSLRLLEGDVKLLASLSSHLSRDLTVDPGISQKLEEVGALLNNTGIGRDNLRDMMVTRIVKTCESVAREVVTVKKEGYAERDHRIDRFLTSRITGIPVMILLLLAIFWLTITGANYPSGLVAGGLFWLEERLAELMRYMSAPAWLTGMLLEGIYRTLAWVVSVMLPPMAIFFPLFTLLEDSGYLPRIAFNMDGFFRKACAHGKQALTMCMGFGCNAAGVIGCRIIDSPRERLIAIITNNFVPCNGRFPILIAISTMFFTVSAGGAAGSVVSTLLLTAVIMLGVAMTLAVSRILSATVLKGLPSSFNLELPPYRRPQIGRVIVRSVFDRTLFVLGRAAAVAAPAGLIIWLMANIQPGGISLLSRCAEFLDPFGQLLGMDGYIIMAFILGFPANEIVVPIIIMSYMSAGQLTEPGSLSEMRMLFINHGWTRLTAVCVMLFSLMHWPCGTTFLTIKKETQSLKWTAAAFAIPTAAGIILCIIVAGAARLLGIA